MFKIIFSRILTTIPVVLAATVIIFLMIQLAPGDPAVQAAGGGEARPEDIERIRLQLGLDDPMHIQYLRWASGAIQGDLGESLAGEFNVGSEIKKAFPVTLSITVVAVFVALLIGIPVGIVAAYSAGRYTDRLVTSVATLGIASPNYFVGLLLAMYFGRKLGWLPAVGYKSVADAGIAGWLGSIVLPSIALGTAVAAEMARHLRASLRDVLQSDYVKTARASGHPELAILGRYALKNASIPLITVLGLQFRNLLGGAVPVELVFALNGLGSLAIRAVFDRDFPMLQGIMLVSLLIVVVVNLLVDISYSFLNPKVRTS